MNHNNLMQPPNGKKAILTVGFGTLHQEAQKKTIAQIAEKIKSAFPGYATRQAITSRVIAAGTPQNGGKTETEREALTTLQKEGYREIIVQSLHITAGQEFEKLSAAVKEFAAAGAFEKIAVGRPLLYYVGQEKKPDDYQAVVDAIVRGLPPFNRNEAVVMQGHDGFHPANSSYGTLQLKFIDAGYPNIYIFTIKGYPRLTNVIEKLKNDGVEKVTLMPFMLTAGGHAINDMAGDKSGSAKSLLIKAGFLVEVRLCGLGENRYIQDIFVRHAQDAAGVN